jgi:hypothetical protein
MRWWQRALLYGAASAVPGALIYGPEVLAWPGDVVVVTLVCAATIAVTIEGLLWFVEGFSR